MSDYRDLSTWRLKRRYIRHIKNIWYRQTWTTIKTSDLDIRSSYQEELRHRGWHV